VQAQVLSEPGELDCLRNCFADFRADDSEEPGARHEDESLRPLGSNEAGGGARELLGEPARGFAAFPTLPVIRGAVHAAADGRASPASAASVPEQVLIREPPLRVHQVRVLTKAPVPLFERRLVRILDGKKARAGSVGDDDALLHGDPYSHARDKPFRGGITPRGDADAALDEAKARPYGSIFFSPRRKRTHGPRSRAFRDRERKRSQLRRSVPITRSVRMILRSGLRARSLSFAVVSVALLAHCGSDDADCITNVDGTVACTGYADAYPYDYAYAGYDTGYYPYTVYVYDDPVGYDVTYSSVILGGVGRDGGPAGGEAGADAGRPTGSPVPELLDMARRGANAINAGIRTTLDPIKDILKSTPIEGDNTLTYGPMDRGPAVYRFVVRRLSAAEKRYGWTLEARPAGSNASYVPVAGSSIQVGDTPRRGRGVLGADYDAQSSADTSVRAKGKLLLGFADDATTKTLRFVLDGYTPDPAVIDPLDATAISWHELGEASSLRVVTRTNLEETASAAPEVVAIKLRWRKGEGVRADAVATGGDVPQGNRMFVSTCVPPNLDRSDASTSTKTCELPGVDCKPAISCPSGLETADEPQTDPMADDPPAGIPEAPNPPSTVPSGTESP
jgi:hypothetical protein